MTTLRPEDQTTIADRLAGAGLCFLFILFVVVIFLVDLKEHSSHASSEPPAVQSGDSETQ